MKRRAFFATLLAPYLARFAPRLCPVVEYAMNTTPVTGTIGAIDRATYTFWRNQHVYGESRPLTLDMMRMREVFDACEKVP